MTLPRPIFPCRAYLLTRRCAQRQYLLRPDGVVESIYLYCLGEAAARYRVTLHGYMAMSNHSHLVVRDNEGNLPRFTAHLHKMIALAVNFHRGRSENFWAARPPSAVHLVGAHDRFTKLVYLLANPVASHLVARVAEWPGACSLAQSLSARTITVKRPRGFFREDGPLPDQVSLSIERVDGFEDLTQSEWSAKVAAAVRAAEDLAHVERIEKDLSVLGREAVLATSFTDRPETLEPRSGWRPYVACGDVDRRASELQEVRRFRAAHREVLRKWREGDRSTPFPAGTYRMRDFGGT
jgi:hypothetical protein